jgi:hypothetical protein
MSTVRTFWLALVVLLASCVRVPSLSPAEADAFQAAAQALLKYAAATPNASGPLPSGIGGLEPKSTRIAPEGVYFETSSWLVEEAGVFVPRNPDAFKPVRGSDPEYEHIHGSVFTYRIRG